MRLMRQNQGPVARLIPKARGWPLGLLGFCLMGLACGETPGGPNSEGPSEPWKGEHCPDAVPKAGNPCESETICRYERTCDGSKPLSSDARKHPEREKARLTVARCEAGEVTLAQFGNCEPRANRCSDWEIAPYGHKGVLLPGAPCQGDFSCERRLRMCGSTQFDSIRGVCKGGVWTEEKRFDCSLKLCPKKEPLEGSACDASQHTETCGYLITGCANALTGELGQSELFLACESGKWRITRQVSTCQVKHFWDPSEPSPPEQPLPVQGAPCSNVLSQYEVSVCENGGTGYLRYLCENGHYAAPDFDAGKPFCSPAKLIGTAALHDEE